MVEDGKVSNANDAAASFQEAIVSILAVKTIAAAKEHGVKQILMSGGVASNRSLRRRLGQESHVPVLIPEPILCTDNAAMVAACGYFRLQAGGLDGLDMDVIPSLRMV
jgi:N6-L-threonylcarbamoyladenine synthase